MYKLRFFHISSIFIALLLSANTYAYWATNYANSGSHFQANFLISPVVQNWQISSTDKYVSMSVFIPDDGMVLGVKPGSQYLLMYHTTPQNKWRMLDHGTTHIGGIWPTHADDRYIVGDFDGDGDSEIFATNPDGRMTVLKPIRSGMFYNWQSLYSDQASGINSNDQLLAGDFNGDGRDELMIIRPHGAYYTLSFNQQQHRWDLVSSATNGLIHYWVIAADDTYTVGDFNGDGSDELLAVATNGWHHTIDFQANTWQWIEGDGSGLIAYWVINSGDSFLALDTDDDGKDELLTISAGGHWSHLIGFSGSSWVHRDGNSGSSQLGNNSLSLSDTYMVKRRNNQKDQLYVFNPNGSWSVNAKP